MIDEKDPGANGTEQLVLRYIDLDTVALWDENPKKHDVDGIINSIELYGFVDPPKFDGKLNNGAGGLVFGNGRSKCVKLLRERDPDKVPRGIIVQNGIWYLPVLFGIDAESEEMAMGLALDHNNLTMAGGDFDHIEIAKMWDSTQYLAVLNMIRDNDIPLASISPENIDDLLASISGDVQFIGGDFQGEVPVPPDTIPLSQVRMVQLFFNIETHALFIEMCKKLSALQTSKTLTDIVFEVVRNACNQLDAANG